MKISSTNTDPEAQKPIVIVFENGSNEAYSQINQALGDAQIDCILMQGQSAKVREINQQNDKNISDSSDSSKIKYSVIIPIYNEEDNIPELYRRLSEVMNNLVESFEVIFVNDGSRDHSLMLLTDLCKTDPHVRVINLTRNFGHQRAISAGIDYAKGKAVIVMDGDLQDPPEVIPQFIEKWHEDFQVVYAIRKKRKENVIKRFFYHAFYLLLQTISRTDIPLDAGDFCLMDRCVVNELIALPERNRFVRGLRSWVGFRQVGLAYERDMRFAGNSKYTFKKLGSLALDGVISFSYMPLHIATMVGMAVSIFSLLAAVYYVIKKLTVGLQPPGFATLTVLLLFLGGVQMITVGIIGEYIGHILDETKGRPTYVVQQVIEHEKIRQE